MPELNWAAGAAAIARMASAAAAVLSLSVAAHAGGYDTGERDWDFLFQQGNFAAEAQTRYIDPQRTLKNIQGVLGYAFSGKSAPSNPETEAFSVERFSLTARLTQNVRCMGSYRQPFEGHANYGMWFAAASATEQHFTSEDYGLTCAVSAPVGMGQLLFIGGASYQTITYELLQNYASLFGPAASTNVSDDGVGWRAGIGYEIPQYALRATLIYNSAIGYDMTGTGVNLPVIGVPRTYANSPLAGSITMPQSLELKAQSGVAPGWLAFGAIKWTNWGAVQDMPLCAPGAVSCVTGATAPTALTLLWRDSWTMTLGAAHQFSDQFSLAGSLTWDQGASQGFTSQTDTWTANLTGVWTPHKNFEFRFGGAVGVLTGGSLSTATLPGGIPNAFGYTATFGDDLVYSLNASAALHY